jgi:hypothetical protein
MLCSEQGTYPSRSSAASDNIFNPFGGPCVVGAPDLACLSGGRESVARLRSRVPRLVCPLRVPLSRLPWWRWETMNRRSDEAHRLVARFAERCCAL